MTGWTVDGGVPVWTDHHGRAWSLGDDRLHDVWPAMDGVDADRALAALARTIEARPATVSVTESLECDGGSISAWDAAGRRLALTVTGRKRVYRTERITYEIGEPL